MSLSSLYEQLLFASEQASAVARRLDQILGGVRELGGFDTNVAVVLPAQMDESAKGGRDRASHEMMQCVSAVFNLNARFSTNTYASAEAVRDEVPRHLPKNPKSAADLKLIERYLTTSVAAGYLTLSEEGFQTSQKAEAKLAHWLSLGRIVVVSS